MNGSQLSTWWDTIRQARLFRVLAVYVGASFAVLQLVDILTNQLGLPDWFFPGALALLLIGLPIVVATALLQSVPRPRPAASSADAAAPESRPQSATAAADVAVVGKRWLTWRRAIIGGVLAFVLLGVTVAGYMAMRVLGIGPVGSLVAAGVLDERERIILADFQGGEGDAQLAGTATEAFRIDLSQSPLVRLVDPTHLGQVLARMEREPTAGLRPGRRTRLGHRGLRAPPRRALVAASRLGRLPAGADLRAAGLALRGARRYAESGSLLQQADRALGKRRSRVAAPGRSGATRHREARV